ncbi:histidine phosphatase family protein [Halobacillus salinarum]|uniref:Histidine phosphatase family protein n=1 Tax=Halobacillus salinarum TaxID=2932257 RepID=A0ABY4EQR9_9BACI|nr:histidine phosphatase family protein [Halobacillus salinarum]UOQ45989.1 histidine phosphatase family protein [Halobacillus salinarum]
MTTIGFIRHGSTFWNKIGRAQGSMNIPLDDEGKDHACLLANRLKGEKWEYLISSDLLRAVQTAEIIAELNPHLSLIQDKRLREIDGGKIEGTTEEERVQRWGKDWRTLDLGREDTSSVVERGMDCINDWIEKYPGKNVLFVTHGGMIKQLLTAMGVDSIGKSPLMNTSITCVSRKNDKYVCELYNCTMHLSN